MSALATEVDEKLKVYQAMQGEIQKLYFQKQQALSQFNENTLVKGELDLLGSEDKVYKLVGPVLMSIELEESKDNVSKRLSFIETEVEKVERAINAKIEEQKKLGDEIAALQQSMQAGAAKAVKELTDGLKG
eukprot:gene14835-19934_t